MTVARPTLHGPRVLLRQLQPADKLERLAIGWNAEAERMYGRDAADRLPPFTYDDAQALVRRHR